MDTERRRARRHDRGLHPDQHENDQGAAPAPAQARPGETPTGTSGLAATYEIKGIDDEKLKQHVGRRVQIEGTFEDVDPNWPTPDKATSADDLVELAGTSIRQVAGECLAKS